MLYLHKLWLKHVFVLNEQVFLFIYFLIFSLNCWENNEWEDWWVRYERCWSCRARGKQVNASKQTRKNDKQGDEWKVWETEAESGSGAETRTNLRERISSGRVIKSESQQTYLWLSPPFSPLCPHPFRVISCLHSWALISLLGLPFNLLSFCVCLSPVPGQLLSFCLSIFQQKLRKGRGGGF